MNRFVLNSVSAKVSLVVLLCSFLMVPARATTWYIDSAANGSNNGTSWANAWKTLKAATSVKSGDTVYISGGASGNTQTYPVDVWSPSYPGQWGTAVNGATYKIGQDSAHNGTAIFDALGGSYWLVQDMNGVTISGDAGDGAMHFKLKDNSVSGQSGAGGGWKNVRVAYVDFGKQPGGIDFNPGGTSVEVDHCYFYLVGDSIDHGSYASFNNSAYDTVTFHDNTLYVPHNSTNTWSGADGLQWNGSGFSIYNNTIVSYASPTYASNGQHADGWQATGNASYIKIYGNRFLDFANYAIYQEPAFGGYSHTRIYNNIAICTIANSSQGIVVAANATKTLTDCVVANNVSDGYYYGFTFRDSALSPNPNAFFNCSFYNNISVNSTGDIIDSTVTSANNVRLTAAQAASTFARYSANSSSNDYHLKSTATNLIGKGTNLASYFLTDILGLVRGSWDIGAYSSGSGSGSSTTAPNNAKITISTQ